MTKTQKKRNEALTKRRETRERVSEIIYRRRHEESMSISEIVKSYHGSLTESDVLLLLKEAEERVNKSKEA